MLLSVYFCVTQCISGQFPAWCNRAPLPGPRDYSLSPCIAILSYCHMCLCAPVPYIRVFPCTPYYPVIIAPKRCKGLLFVYQPIVPSCCLLGWVWEWKAGNRRHHNPSPPSDLWRRQGSSFDLAFPKALTFIAHVGMLYSSQTVPIGILLVLDCLFISCVFLCTCILCNLCAHVSQIAHKYLTHIVISVFL